MDFTELDRLYADADRHKSAIERIRQVGSKNLADATAWIVERDTSDRLFRLIWPHVVV